MPLFAIIAFDKPDAGALRAETRPAHLDHLHAIQAQVRVAGPLDGPDGKPVGSLIVAEFAALGAAQAFADSDPYAKAGLFAKVRVSAWRQVVPAA
ncbi:MAG: hypothetical protein JOY99_07880 [Sphingomonadaceae bacterium]|nr:hypothetical protein [Sphingomonadaceae bacterium]